MRIDINITVHTKELSAWLDYNLIIIESLPGSNLCFAKLKSGHLSRQFDSNLPADIFDLFPHLKAQFQVALSAPVIHAPEKVFGHRSNSREV